MESQLVYLYLIDSMLYLLVYISVIACEQVLGWETREKERLQAESKGRGGGREGKEREWGWGKGKGLSNCPIRHLSTRSLFKCTGTCSYGLMSTSMRTQ